MHLRYGAIGRETVCTENLTPWKKLLPCKQNGLVTLFNPIKLYENVYHSIGFQLHPFCEGTACKWHLQLMMYNVIDISLKNKGSHWSLFDIFGRKIVGVCNAASSSKIVIEVDDKSLRLEPAPTEVVNKLEGTYAIYDLRNKPSDESFTVSASYDKPSPSNIVLHSPVSVSTLVGSTDQMSGVLASVIKNEGKAQRVVYTHLIPWFLHIYYHTISLTCKGEASKEYKTPHILNRHFVPAIARQRPALVEMEFDMPANAECRMQIKFEKAFLRIREYPPDANHGMYVPGAIITLPGEKQKPGNRSTS
ncbi:unnamed protein product [Cylicostephanus goldi]|uniref:Uncharacterized protein n=1 Tax=Cylicostephanus goldi TaxID=71465 RepID=A0A3P7MPJ2_CYLGO|nr:unnamed protein product [Cylicostephanus goldi]